MERRYAGNLTKELFCDEVAAVFIDSGKLFFFILRRNFYYMQSPYCRIYFLIDEIKDSYFRNKFTMKERKTSVLEDSVQLPLHKP